jgi:tagaturonate reductase
MKMTNRILQFGTSRFLQAHADLFVHEAILSGQDIGPITIVKTTLGGPRDNRTAAFSKQAGFPIHLRGYTSGNLVDHVITVKSVRAALDANRDWHKLVEVFTSQTEIVISNVGDGGYVIAPADQHRPAMADHAPAGFPAKFLLLLLARFEKSGTPLLVLPCELIGNNGQVLRKLLSDLAVAWGESDAFQRWLADHVTICDTLVDRIVSEALDPVGAVAEPYGLWAIKREANLEPPLQNPCIVYTDDLEPYLRLKLHILNLGHTYLAGIWQSEKRKSNETVREIMADPDIKSRLMGLYATEIIPGFAARDMEHAAKTYVSTTLERFENPFLNHRISDIFDNHAIKIERRMVDFMAWTRQRNETLQFPQLEGIAAIKTSP